MKPWTIKYRPKNTSEIQGQDKALSRLKRYIENYKKEKKKAVLVYGSPGCGKTAAAHAVANEFSLEIIEINASDVRNKNAINEKLGPAISQQSLFSKGKLILVDEIDGLSGRKDRGGVSAILKLIKKSGFPMVLTANDPYDKKFSGLRKKSELIEFKSLNYRSVKKVLKKICYNEKINYDDLALTALARRSGGDLRGAIIDLQVLTQNTKRLKMQDLDELSDRRQTESMLSALVKVLKSTKPEIALTAFNDVSENFDEVFLWIDENTPKEYKKTIDLARAYDNISLADVFRGRIRRWQHWHYLVYINQLLSAGVAISKDKKYKGFTRYGPTKRIFKIWRSNIKTKKKKAIAEKIAKITHTSPKRVLNDTLPYIKLIYENNKELAKKLTNDLDLQKQEVTWMRKK